jgi:hypothetical protein
MIAFSSLEKIGFTRNKMVVDEDLKYQSCDITKNESYISVVNEYDSKGHIGLQIIEMNDRTLKGKEPTIETLKLLIEIL